MASTLLTFRPTGIQACAAAAASSSSHRKSDQRTQSSNWWTPLFGWTSDPDYITTGNNSITITTTTTTTTTDKSKSRSVDSDSDNVTSRSRFTPGGFTEEKAKQLRIKTMESETFHDIMYHSAIASRLASDLPMRSGR